MTEQQKATREAIRLNELVACAKSKSSKSYKPSKLKRRNNNNNNTIQVMQHNVGQHSELNVHEP